MTRPWLRRFSRASGCRVQLVCLPYAGGGASLFARWSERLPEEVEVVAVQLPGREDRIAEHPFLYRPALVERLAEETFPVLNRIPVFFGYSMGALLAYELACVAADTPAAPRALLLGARAAPHLDDGPRIAHLDDERFLAHIREYNGTPPEILAHEEILSLVLPALRADFALCESAPPPVGTTLSCPVSTYAGANDRYASPSAVDAWRNVTTGSFRCTVFPGDHFFIHSNLEGVLAQIRLDLALATAP